MKFKIELTSGAAAGMASDILKDMTRQINSAFNGASVSITNRVSQLAAKAIEDSSVVRSLDGGELYDLLCLSDRNIGSNLTRTISSEIVVSTDSAKQAGKVVDGGITVKMLPDDYRDILGIHGSTYGTINGFQVNWLEWLLFYGTSSLIQSGMLIRTDRGVLLVSSKNDFYIPPTFAGTQDDNFLTRALQPLEDTIGNLIMEEISRRL